MSQAQAQGQGRPRPALQDRLAVWRWTGPVLALGFGVAVGVGMAIAGAPGWVIAGGVAAVSVAFGVAIPRLARANAQLRRLPLEDGAQVVQVVRTGGTIGADLAPQVRAHATAVEHRIVTSARQFRLLRRPMQVIAVVGMCFVIGGLVLGNSGQVVSAGVWTMIGALNGWVAPRAQATALANARRARDNADLLGAGGAS